MRNEESLFTLKEARRKLKIGKKKLREYRQSGVIRTLTIGGKLMITESEIQRFIAAEKRR